MRTSWGAFIFWVGMFSVGPASGVLHVYIYTYIYICVHMYMYAYMHTCIYMYIYTHTHTYSSERSLTIGNAQNCPRGLVKMRTSPVGVDIQRPISSELHLRDTHAQAPFLRTKRRLLNINCNPAELPARAGEDADILESLHLLGRAGLQHLLHRRALDEGNLISQRLLIKSFCPLSLLIRMIS